MHHDKLLHRQGEGLEATLRSLNQPIELFAAQIVEP